MACEVYIGLHKTLCHDPTLEFCIHKDKESSEDVGSVDLEASKTANPEVVVVPPPKNAVLSLPIPLSSDEPMKKSLTKSPLLLKRLSFPS